MYTENRASGTFVKASVFLCGIFAQDFRNFDKTPMEFLRDLIDFLSERKKWWMAPVILLLLFIVVLFIIGGSSPLGPYIYSLF